MRNYCSVFVGIKKKRDKDTFSRTQENCIERNKYEIKQTASKSDVEQAKLFVNEENLKTKPYEKCLFLNLLLEKF